MMEHWNSFKNDNGTIEFSDMEQWNKSLEQVENNISSFKSKKDTDLLSNIINALIKLYNELTDKIKYSFVKLDNIDRLKSVINAMYIETSKYYEKRKGKDRKELLDKINLLRFEINLFEEKFYIHYKIENILHCISSNSDSSGAKDIEDKMHKLSEYILKTHSNNSYDEFCNIIKKWIYIVDFIIENQLCNLDKINKYDAELCEKYGKFEAKLWLNELQKLSCCNIDIIMTDDFISNLTQLNEWLYKGIANKTIDGTYISDMFDFLIYLYTYVCENSNSDSNTKVISEIDKLISYCLNSNYNDIEISCENIQLNEWKETLSFHLYPKEKYSMYYFNFYRYIDKLKSGISLNTLKNDTYFMKNYKRLKLNDLIAKLEKLYSDDKPESKTTKNSFVNNDYKKTEAILNILLDGDIDFIIHNGRYQFSQTSVETLNFLLNKHFDNEDMDYNDELMERFKKELKKGNIKSFDSIFSNKNKENNEDPYYLFKDIFLPEIHSLIADLYDINTNCHFSDINTTLTYELLTHKTYNKLVNEFNLLYDDILNYHSTNIASVHVTRIIQHRFSPILNMIKEFPAVFIIPEEPKDVEITYDIIKSVLTSFKKVYNIDLIKNESCTMEYLQRLTENIIDLRALLNLTNAKGTA